MPFELIISYSTFFFFINLDVQFAKMNPFILKTFHLLSLPHFIPTELREDGFHPQTYLVQGVKALHTALKLWMKKEVSHHYCFFMWQD